MVRTSRAFGAAPRSIGYRQTVKRHAQAMKAPKTKPASAYPSMSQLKPASPGRSNIATGMGGWHSLRVFGKGKC
jgi:hypothetical protein